VSVLERDPVVTARRLEEWLQAVAGVEEPRVGEIEIPSATGWSNETILFSATWRGTGPATEEHRLVARIAPSEYTVFPDDTFLGQYHVMAALAAHTDVSVANVHWLETSEEWFGRPFWIMDRIDGDIGTDAPPYAAQGWLHDASPHDQARAWWSGIEAMAALHRLDPDDLGVDMSLMRDGDGSAESHLDHLENFLTWAEDGDPHEGVRRALHLLRDSGPPTPSGPPALSWGDARFSNLIFRDFRVVAVLDWEMASIGDPLLDLGWWLFSDTTLSEGTASGRLPGFPSAAETARRWEELTGRRADSLDWYRLYAAARFATIMLRMGTLLHDMGLVDGDFARHNFISNAMCELTDSMGR